MWQSTSGCWCLTWYWWCCRSSSWTGSNTRSSPSSTRFPPRWADSLTHSLTTLSLSLSFSLSLCLCVCVCVCVCLQPRLLCSSDTKLLLGNMAKMSSSILRPLMTSQCGLMCIVRLQVVVLQADMTAAAAVTISSATCVCVCVGVSRVHAEYCLWLGQQSTHHGRSLSLTTHLLQPAHPTPVLCQYF